MSGTTTSRETLLEVSALLMRFGGITAVDGLSMSVHQGEIVSVIGPNGAGKTSAFNCISGFYRPSAGSIKFLGKEITHTRPSKITEMGMARTFQNLRLFKDMSVLDNVKTGAHSRESQHWFDAFLKTGRYRKSEKRIDDRALGWLEFVGFTADPELLVTQLPYGEQRRVEIARALNTSPRLLLLDEPAAGLNHVEKQGLIDLIRKIQALGVSIVLIEHDMGLVMDISERIIVLNYGKEMADGTPEEIRNNPLVIEAYLGSSDEEPADTFTDLSTGLKPMIADASQAPTSLEDTAEIAALRNKGSHRLPPIVRLPHKSKHEAKSEEGDSK